MNDSADPNPRDHVATIEQAVETVGRDLLIACIGELRATKKPWDEMTEKQQANAINRVREVVRFALQRGFAIMATAGFPSTQATLEKVAFTVKGVQGTLSLSTTSSDRHALSDHAGGQVVVILTSADRYMAKIDEVQPMPDQAALPLGEPDTSGFDGERHDVGDAGAGEAAAPPTPASVDVGGEEIPLPVDVYPGALSLEAVADAMALAGLDADLVEISGWLQGQRAEVVDFCAALHLKEGGADVVVPKRPDVLGGGAP